MRPGLLLFLGCALACACAGAARAPAGAAGLPRWAVSRGDARFTDRLGSALARLQSTKAGARLLADIGACGRGLVFRPSPLPSDFASGLSGPPVVWWNPDFGAPETPAFVALHHELVHALQRLQGRADGGDWMEDEAAGLGRFAAEPVSENALRRELGLPPRLSHDALPGFSEARLDRLFEQAYADPELPRRQAAADGPGVRFRRVDDSIPAWVEREEAGR